MSGGRRLRWTALLAAGLALLCIIGLAVTLVTLPRPPRTHRETVAEALARRGVPYAKITFRQTYEESVELDVFRAQVVVRTPDGRDVSGWIGCEDRDRVCFLELRGLGIVGERLPELDSPRPWPWLEWVGLALRRLGLA